MSASHESKQVRLTRRGFGALAAGGLASLALGACSRSRAAPAEDHRREPLRFAEGDSVPVVLAGVPRGAGEEAIEGAVRRAALATTDLSWLSRGDTVLIKPVCNSGNPYPATTDPVALRAMIRLLKERGAGRVLVADMSGVEHVRFSKDHRSGSTRELMRNSGLAQAVESAGGEVFAFEEAGWDGFYEERPLASASWSRPIMLPQILRDTDHVVLMPRCSRHLLAGSTLGLKAAVGWWRHDSRLEYHHDAATFAEKTAEGNTVPSLIEKQRLVLTSATHVLATFGPDSGHAAEPETGLMIASPSVLAHDMVSLAWLIATRRALAPDVRDGVFNDPNQSRAFVNFANRIVTYWLGGFGAAMTVQLLRRYDLGTVWDDRVLRHAAAVFGGVPRVELVDPEQSVPRNIRDALAAQLAPPLAGVAG